MESYSMFSSSSNSASSSSNNNNFPFPLSHVSTDDHFNGFDMEYDNQHHYHDHRGGERSEPLIGATMIHDDDHQQQYYEPIMPELSQPLMSNHDDDDRAAGDDLEREAVKMANKNNGSNKGKKGSLTEKKIKKHRYAFQTRSQVDILDDGYRWRKYGQKAVKNNNFPRSYYRCTYQGCNVKKQVQRLSNDEEVVVTTYEGMHSHSMDSSTDNFEHILNQMQIYTPF